MEEETKDKYDNLGANIHRLRGDLDTVLTQLWLVQQDADKLYWLRKVQITLSHCQEAVNKLIENNK